MSNTYYPDNNKRVIRVQELAASVSESIRQIQELSSNIRKIADEISESLSKYPKLVPQLKNVPPLKFPPANSTEEDIKKFLKEYGDTYRWQVTVSRTTVLVDLPILVITGTTWILSRWARTAEWIASASRIARSLRFISGLGRYAGPIGILIGIAGEIYEAVSESDERDELRSLIKQGIEERAKMRYDEKRSQYLKTIYDQLGGQVKLLSAYQDKNIDNLIETINFLTEENWQKYQSVTLDKIKHDLREEDQKNGSWTDEDNLG